MKYRQLIALMLATVLTAGLTSWTAAQEVAPTTDPVATTDPAPSTDPALSTEAPAPATTEVLSKRALNSHGANPQAVANSHGANPHAVANSHGANPKAGVRAFAQPKLQGRAIGGIDWGKTKSDAQKSPAGVSSGSQDGTTVSGERKDGQLGTTVSATSKDGQMGAAKSTGKRVYAGTGR